MTPSWSSPSHVAPTILLAALLVLAGTAGGRGGETTGSRTSADELMERALARDEAARTARANWRHDEELTTERFSASGQSLGSAVNSRRGVASGETPGASGSVDTGSSKEKDEDFRVTLDLRRLAGRFDLERAADEPSADGERCYVIAFRPRAEPPAHANREEKVIDQLSGRFWLSQRDLSIVQSEAELLRPVTVAWVASVYRLDFRYRGRRLPGRAATVVPASFVLDLGVSAPLYHSRQRQTTTMTNYQPPSDADTR